MSECQCWITVRLSSRDNIHLCESIRKCYNYLNILCFEGCKRAVHTGSKKKKKKKKKKNKYRYWKSETFKKGLLYKLLEPTASYLFGIMKFFTKYLPITNNFMELLFDRVSKTFLVIRNTPLLPRWYHNNT